MSHREFNAQRTMLANAMATAGAELLEYMGTAGALAAIPNTDPPRYVVAGTLQIIAKLLPTAEAAPAVQAPSQVPAELTDERIDTIAKPYAGMGGVEDYRSFARAIERQLRAGNSDVRDQALEEVVEFLTMQEGWTDAEKKVVGVCVKLIYLLKHNPGIAGAPAASKEGGASHG